MHSGLKVFQSRTTYCRPFFVCLAALFSVLLIACQVENVGAEVQVADSLPFSCVHAMPNEYRSTVALALQPMIDGMNVTDAFCSGVLIANDRVATAKHCVMDMDPRLISVVFHPDLSAAGAAHRKPVLGYALSPNQDVAVLLIGGVPQGSSYRSAQLVGNVGDIASGAKLRVLGYGATNRRQEGIGSSPHVRCAEPLLTSFVPSKRPRLGDGSSMEFKYALTFGKVHDIAQFKNGWIASQSKGTLCLGDSGGPIFVHHRGAYKLLGINTIPKI